MFLPSKIWKTKPGFANEYPLIWLNELQIKKYLQEKSSQFCNKKALKTAGGKD